MAFDQFGNVVPDGTPGSSPMPPVGQTGAPAPGAAAGFGGRGVPIPGFRGLNPVLSPAIPASGGAPGSPAQGPPAPASPTTVGATTAGAAPAPTNLGSSTGFGSSPTAGQFGAGASIFDPMDPTRFSIAYSGAHGIGPYSGQQAVVADRSSNLPLVYMLLNPKSSFDPQNYTDWADQYMSQGGGQGMSTADFMNGAFSNDTTNPVFNMLHLKKNADGTSTALSAPEQVQAFSQLMQSGLAQTVPPMVLNAMLAMYGQAGNEYIAATQSGQFNGSYTDFLQQRGLGPGVLGG